MNQSSDTFREGDPTHARRMRGRFLYEARWFAALALALTGLLGRGLGFLESAWPSVVIAGLIAVFNEALRRSVSAPSNAAVAGSLLADIAALTAFLHYTGDMENPLTFAYSLPVAAAAVLVSRRAAFLLAGVATLFFTALVMLTLFERLPHYHLRLIESFRLLRFVDPEVNDQAWNYIFAHLLGLSAILFGTAAGLGTLSERLGEQEVLVRREYEQLSLLLDVLPQGVLLLSPDASVRVSNSAARALLGVSDREHDAAVTTHRVRERLDGSQAPSEAFETRVQGRILSHVLARAGPAGAVVWVIQDLTDQRGIMAQMIHSAKMADLGLLAAGIAHEIGNPLSSMSALLERLESRSPAPDTQERIHALQQHVGRIHRIVRSVGEFSRSSSERPSGVAPAAVVQQALGVFRFHERARAPNVVVEDSARSLQVMVIADQITQVLLNLLLNAADACPAGEIRIAIRSAGEFVAIDVVDQGPGMPPEVVERLFTPFFTTKEPGRGVGLGLFVSESILRAQGGRIDIRSSPGEGTTFTVLLPSTEAHDGPHSAG